MFGIDDLSRNDSLTDLVSDHHRDEFARNQKDSRESSTETDDEACHFVFRLVKIVVTDRRSSIDQNSPARFRFSRRLVLRNIRK